MEYKKCENPACENIVTERLVGTKKLKQYCSISCGRKHQYIVTAEKRKHTCLMRYKTECAAQAPEIKKRIRETNLKNHGVENVFQSPEIKEKIKETNLEKHGVENPMDLEWVKEKLKKTNLEKHGVENVFQSFKIKEKSKQTMLARHGVEYALQSPKLKEKFKETMLSRHGVEHAMYSEKIKDSVRRTNQSVYGSDNPASRHLSQRTQILLNDHIWLISQNETKTLKEIANDLNINKLILSRRFKKLNLQVNRHAKSFFEKQIYEFVKSIYPNIIQNDRKQIKPLELDIYFPLLNLAIECNGRYFHQDQEREQNKIDRCKEKGIDLYFIWDDEWYANTEYWKQYITNIIKQKSPN